MSARPKPAFWFAVLLVIAGLAWFAYQRAGIGGTFGRGDDRIAPGPAGGSAARPPPARTPTQVLELSLSSSSAKKSWINKAVEEFNAAHQEISGRIVRVSVAHVESGQSLEDLKTGRIKPDLWSPGDESWIHLANSHWRSVHQRELIQSHQPLLNVPLVIAMWEPMARALGYPKPIGWRDIARLAANPRGWTALGHPEWGPFRWGHAHPDANSGFLAIIAEVYAALGKRDGITPQDLKNPKLIEFLRNFEGAVEHYGLSNTWIDDLMHAKGPSYLSCAVQYENTIIESNEKHRNRPFKLVALYPSEGMFWTRHPIAVLNESWVTPEKAAAGAKLIQFLLSKEAQSRAMQLGLRPIRADVALGAPFDDSHGVMTDVSHTLAFTVPDESVLKRIRDLWEDVKLPATVMMIIDRSGSMNGPAMDQARLGAVNFVQQMRPRDMVSVVAFNNRVTEIVPLCQVRDCGERAVGQINGIFAEGGTSLHDVVAHSYGRLRQQMAADPRRRYGILLLSDGKDTSSAANRNDFLDALPKGEQHDVPKIFSIAYGDAADRDLLTEVSNRTNARVFKSSPEEIQKTYKELSANF